MFGNMIQTQFSMFESIKWWAQVQNWLFGTCSHLLYSKKSTAKSTPWCETIFSNHGYGLFVGTHNKGGPTGPTNKKAAKPLTLSKN